MEKSKIDLYLTTNSKYFEPTAIPIIRQKLENASDDALVTLQATELKDPTTNVNNLRKKKENQKNIMIFFLFLL